SPQLADPRGDRRSLRSDHTPERRVAELLDVALQSLEDHVALDLRDVVSGIADKMPVSLQLVVIPGGRRNDDVGKLSDQSVRRALLVGVLRRAVLDVAGAGVHEGR